MNDMIEAEYQEVGTAIAIREETQSGIMPTVSPDEARAQMRAYQELCAAVLTDDDYQEFTETKSQKIGNRWEKVTTTKRFKKKSAVKKLQTYFGISVDVVDDSIRRDDLGDGHFGFRCKAVAMSPGGRSVAALAGCSTHEERFDVKRYDDETAQRYAERQKKALARSYHDVLSTAETRATNRAVMNLVSPGEVTAEEISRSPKPPRDESPSAGRRSQPVKRVPQDDLLALAASRGIPDAGAFGRWCVEQGIAPDLASRKPRNLTDEETVVAKERLEAMPPVERTERPAAAPQSGGSGRMNPKTQGRLFALLDERLSTDKEARLIFAHEHGIDVESFSQLTDEQGRRLIRALELIRPPQAEPDPDDALLDYAEGKLL